MPQTYYRLPWFLWPIRALAFSSCITYIVLISTKQCDSSATPILLIATFVFSFAGIMMDPATCHVFKKRLDDGTLVTAVQPIIGFRQYESVVGATGGYDLGVNGYRREPALVRI